MHQNTKLFPRERRELYRRWIEGDSITELALHYGISRPTVYRTVKKAKIEVFVNLPSVNHRYRTIQYGLKHLSRTERILAKKLARREHRLKRYEKDAPGELVHFDTKKLPVMYGEAITSPREWLHVAVDDFSRFLVADILPDKTSYSSAIFLEETIQSLPFPMEKAYSDNGSEFKGNRFHAFRKVCQAQQIEQKFTRPGRPQTNGKAERVIRTILEECLRHAFQTPQERRKALLRYVHDYNEKRLHSALKIGTDTLSPCHLLKRFLAVKVYTTR
jgi:transposase InsO family protein